MLKLHVLTLISVLLLAVAVGCSSSDQDATDKLVSTTLAAQQGVIETAVASGIETAVADNVEPTATTAPVTTFTPEPVPTDTPVPEPTATSVPSATPAPIPTVTSAPTVTPVPVPTTQPTATPIPSPTPTIVPTPEPTATFPPQAVPTPTIHRYQSPPALTENDFITITASTKLIGIKNAVVELEEVQIHLLHDAILVASTTVNIGPMDVWVRWSSGADWEQISDSHEAGAVSASHIYSEGGNHTATVWAQGERGDSGSVNIEVTVLQGKIAYAYPYHTSTCSVTFSPGSRVAQGGIYIMDDDGSDITQLTINENCDAFPEWSPDRSKIAFSRRGADTGVIGAPIISDIWVMNADGSGQTQLTNTKSHLTRLPDYNPSWSPDASKIVYHKVMAGNKTYVYVINVDGSNRKQIAQGSNPSWSPDGSKIVFSSYERFITSTEDFYVYGIHVINSDGSNEKLIWSNSTDTSLVNGGGGSAIPRPDWSPDGSQIVFESSIHHDGDRTDIYVIDSDGSNVQRLTFGIYQTAAGWNRSPSWSPDGSKIIFESRTTSLECRLLVMNADGSTQEYVEAAYGGSPGSYYVCGKQPDWAPAG
jgi:dipeptidyl aminopeptidase/acylaminoacyl peptidase